MKKTGMKKLFAGLSAVCVIASALPSTGFAAETGVVYGDANCDGSVNLADAVLIMQSIANPAVYGTNGTDKNHITEKGLDNADVSNRGDGVTNKDALAIQKHLLGLCDLPESVQEGTVTTTTTATTTTTSSKNTTTTTTAKTTSTTTSSAATTTKTDPQTDITYIHLKGDSITVDGDNAKVSGSTVTISHSGTYMIDGTLNDGQINVNIADETADADTVKLFLNGVNITGKSKPAILVTNAKNTSINLVDGSENVISDGDTAYAGDFLGAAVIEAKDDLTIKGGEKGTGTLTLTANTQDGISCNNDIKINGGNINVTTLNSTDGTDAIKGKKSVTVKAGNVTVDAEGDGIKSSKGAVTVEGGNISVKAGNDAVQAETTIDISGGTVIAGGDRGLTAVTGVNITGGNVYATATDNQVDEKLLAGSTQSTVLLNCIDDKTNEKDGTWKKANAIVSGKTSDITFTKKYKYVLISDSSINGAKSCTFTNLATGAQVTHTDGKQTQFQLSLVTVFNNVDPTGGKEASTSTDTPSDTTSDSYTITLGTAMATNAKSDVAEVKDNVCTIKQPGKFTVTGEMTGGQIVVDVDKTTYPDGVVELELAGMNLTNTKTSPIYVASIGDEVVISAKNGTENTVSDGTEYTNADNDTGAIYSKDDIKFKGKGTLTVNGNAADAIVGKDDVKIYNGNLIVNAKDDGIRGKDSVTIGNTSSDGSEVDYSNLSVKVKTESGDGIKATSTEASSTAKQVGIVTVNGGTVNIDSYADGIQAEQYFVMNGGDLNIKTYEGAAKLTSGNTGGNQGGFGGGGFGMDGNSNKSDISAKGIKAVGIYDEAGTKWQSAGNIDINGGNITIDSTDDCIHCSGDAVLNAGKLKLASSDDAVHSDAALYIGGKTAGTDYTSLEVYVTACYEGMEAVYIHQNNGNIYIISKDDGYNAAGGSDSSGNNNNTGFGQGGWGFPGGGGFGGSSFGEMNLNGGIVSVNTSFQDADGFDSNGNVVFNGGYYFGNGGDSFDCGDGGSYSIKYNGGYAFGGLGMNGGSSYDMSTQMVFTTSDGTVLASSMSGSKMSYAYGDSSVTAYSGAEITGGTNISTLGQPAIYISGKASGGTQKQLGQGSSTGNSGFPGGPGRPGQQW